MSTKSSLLTRASLAAALAVAPAAGAVVFLQSDHSRQGAEAARSEALRQTHDASARLGRFVEGLRDALSVLAETPAVRNGDAAACSAMLTQLKARFGDQILLTANAADGWAVCSTAGVAPRSIRNGERSSHQLPLQAGGFAVGVWEAGSGPRSSGLHLGVGIQAEGGIGFAGTMTAAVEVARLAEVLRPVPLPPGAELVLVDRNDRIVLRVADGKGGDLKPGDPVPPALMNLLPALPATGVDADAAAGGLVEAADARGKSRLVALAPYVPGTEGALRLAVSFDPASLPAGGAASGGPASMGMMVGFGGLVLALVVAFAGARILLARPLAKALASAAAAAPTGASGARPGGASAPAASGRDGEALLALALETGNLGAWELNPETGDLAHSEGLDAIFGYGRPVERWTWRGVLRHVLPEDRAAAEEAFRGLRAGPGALAHEARIYREGDGSLRTLHVRAVHQRTADGKPRIFGVVADATDAVAAAAADPYAAPPAPAAPAHQAGRAEAQLRLSPAELSHRVRAMLATVQGIAAETLRAPPGTGGLIPAAAKAAFETRLSALGRSHEVLMREDGAKADLSELVNLVLAPHAAGPSGPRHTAGGPSLWVPAAMAVPLSVALHELATNAARHGALGQPNGSVAVTWRLEEVGPGHAPMLRLRWEERGGPRLDGPPRRRGFGLKLLESGLAPEIGGLVSLEFPPTGLVCEIEAPLKATARAASETV